MKRLIAFYVSKIKITGASDPRDLRARLRHVLPGKKTLIIIGLMIPLIFLLLLILSLLSHHLLQNTLSVSETAVLMI